MNLNKGISTPIAILIIVVAATLAGGVFYWQYQKIEKPESEQQQVTKNQQLQEKVDTSDWKTYKSDELGFSIKYPDSLELKEREYFSQSSGIMLSLHFEGGCGQSDQDEESGIVNCGGLPRIPVSIEVCQEGVLGQPKDISSKEKIRNQEIEAKLIKRENDTYVIFSFKDYQFHLTGACGCKKMPKKMFSTFESF